eukprot:TRINITY_DN2628_c0_g1_i1.p1 TRINITY_DN2628_c0_g1~~TRINITY_DN2628_c0_g1_i1.p1  ORF type:complete len:455 (-),score=79.89 TRINITY_DN2628_c0_g1_i1:698-2062(-)
MLFGKHFKKWTRKRPNQQYRYVSLNNDRKSSQSVDSGGFNILFISTVWAEPWSSASGVHTMGIIQAIMDNGWSTHFCSASKVNEAKQYLQDMGVHTYKCTLNDDSFDDIIQQVRPEVVIFDRFVTLEQYGWKVQKYSNDAVRIIDTQDLHFLRGLRQNSIESGDIDYVSVQDSPSMENKQNMLRELAAIHRSDFTWLISSFERELLVNTYGIPEDKLGLSTFFYPTKDFNTIKPFQNRKNFYMIGNFRHPPNKDGLNWLHQKIWPRIRELIPDAEVHVYGAYPDKESMNLTNKENGFIVKGPIPHQHLYKRIEKYRVNLAPLRFGAGIKGKISDGWHMGTPVVTTSVGAEGMNYKNLFGGMIADQPDEFAKQAAIVYNNEDNWVSHSLDARKIMQNKFSKDINSQLVINDINTVRANIDNIRDKNIVGAMLDLQSNNYFKYLSKWIELKNQVRE